MSEVICTFSTCNKKTLTINVNIPVGMKLTLKLDFLLDSSSTGLVYYSINQKKKKIKILHSILYIIQYIKDLRVNVAVVWIKASTNRHAIN